MKRVYIVSKTHLDLGFTDYACNIREKYIDTFIPSAVSLAQKVNTKGNKNFIWTTGSWIIKEALNNSTAEQKENLINALKEGNIVPHAFPFTTHSELFDSETLDYGLSIVDEIDEIRGRKTVAAKMTDVPGHTKAIVPLLSKHGIKLLHIGVNGASAVPEVPECFLWRCGGSEVVVIYSGDYGGAFKCQYADEVLYFDHTLDNHGAPPANTVLNKIQKIKSEYPDYQVSAGTLDDFAQVMWEIRDRLPVIENEIGDTWLHGSASDPYKSAALRELMSLKRKWLNDGSMIRMSEEYKSFSDALLCIGEHTCGMDSKIYFADYENYLKKDFQKARNKDKVTVKHPLRDFPKGIIFRSMSKGKECRYSTIEKSWQEQRGYIDAAVNALSGAHKEEAIAALSRLRPQTLTDISSFERISSEVEFSGFKFRLNEYGAIAHLTYKNSEIIKENNNPLLEYRSYTYKDYDFWFTHYSRNMETNGAWAYPDFGKPMLKHYHGKYPAGRFFYKMTDSGIIREKDNIKIFANLQCDKVLCRELGAPETVQIIYTLTENNVMLNFSWLGKAANRLPEAIFLHLYPAAEDLTLIKTGSRIDCKSVVSKGGKNLHAVEKCVFKNSDIAFEIYNNHSPLVSIGQGKILEFDNKTEDFKKDGISYLLCNNVWGTNFPLWYEDNARFEFLINII